MSVCVSLFIFLQQRLKRDLGVKKKKGIVSGALNYGLKFVVTLLSSHAGRLHVQKVILTRRHSMEQDMQWFCEMESVEAGGTF